MTLATFAALGGIVIKVKGKNNNFDFQSPYLVISI